MATLYSVARTVDVLNKEVVHQERTPAIQIGKLSVRSIFVRGATGRNSAINKRVSFFMSCLYLWCTPSLVHSKRRDEYLGLECYRRNHSVRRWARQQSQLTRATHQSA